MKRFFFKFLAMLLLFIELHGNNTTLYIKTNKGVSVSSDPLEKSIIVQPNSNSLELLTGKNTLKKKGKFREKFVNPISGFTLDMLTIPLLLLGTVDAYKADNPKTNPKGAKKITLCVHGFLHNRSAQVGLKPYLENCSEAGPVFFINLGNPFLSIEDYTKCVQRKIEKIKAMTGNEELEVNLIGHSMGGLVCINYAVKYASEDTVHIAKLITIASPLQGTYIAHAAKLFCQSAVDMLPGSEFIKNLDEKMQSKEFQKIPLYHIGFGGDWVVPRGRTFFLNGKNDFEIAYLGHVSSLYAPKVGKILQKLIQSN